MTVEAEGERQLPLILPYELQHHSRNYQKLFVQALVLLVHLDEGEQIPSTNATLL